MGFVSKIANQPQKLMVNFGKKCETLPTKFSTFHQNRRGKIDEFWIK